MINKLKTVGFLLPLAIFIGLAGYFWKGLTLNPRELPSTLIDQPAPAFKGIALDKHNQQVLNEQLFLGQITLLHVWATWCGVCKAEQNYVSQLAKTNKLRIVGLNYKDERQAALAWLANDNPYWVTIYDSSGKIAMDWGVYGTPETFVIDPKGIIRYKYTGMLTPQVWQDKFVPVLAKIKMAALPASAGTAS